MLGSKYLNKYGTSKQILNIDQDKIKIDKQSYYKWWPWARSLLR